MYNYIRNLDYLRPETLCGLSRVFRCRKTAVAKQRERLKQSQDSEALVSSTRLLMLAARASLVCKKKSLAVQTKPLPTSPSSPVSYPLPFLHRPSD